MARSMKVILCSIYMLCKSGFLRWALPSIVPILVLLFGTIDSLINEHINEINYVLDEQAKLKEYNAVIRFIKPLSSHIFFILTITIFRLPYAIIFPF